MKTKGIPAVVMLLAGFVTCIIGIVQPMETMCEKAVAMLLERVNGEQNGMPVKISFSTSVREGDSIRDLG